ncbi:MULTISPECIES: 2-amino-4-hydroxy-6-hydroxymethyldihydropteridine diphosphokinase [Thalassotalea]|uniref:2-amino-4-hydroxy-6-hydroxymethyldihydropteridine pyrophosphokinase n=1 Tax=Thalassotalea castellviae TaxID=3075612 RepID=A0ABU3A7P5_9GAMM|nr:2-amino-4-hydroxy-6-hydroxymethyldihydropteridine diphosphokinase [Thalassotalea sp. W431]MDT0605128.1 2-amino-4-hydroxy-6-hydroxymethyldihydropteridine diphosphokinase [Thalassotalea sp. W431]
MTLAYIGLGSNLSDPKAQIHLAIEQIKTIPNTHCIKISSLYYSRPMGPQDQPDYMNAVMAVETQLPALVLLDHLQAIENKAGRVRKENRWGARILDLDILLFGDKTINNERLTVPHYGMKVREFVIIPLAEIAETLVMPDGTSISTLAKNIATNDLKIHSQLDSIR